MQDNENWLVLSAYAPLQVVTTANYLRFGSASVRRFGPGASEEIIPHPQSIEVTLTLKRATDDIVLQRSMTLYNPTPEKPFDLNGINLWAGSTETMHVTWVWDFYRLYSGVRLRTPNTEASSLRELKAGDRIIVEGNSGTILQVYSIDSGAFTTETIEPTAEESV